MKKKFFICSFILVALLLVSCTNQLNLNKKSSMAFNISRVAISEVLEDQDPDAVYYVECVVKDFTSNETVASQKVQVSAAAQIASFSFNGLNTDSKVNVFVNIYDVDNCIIFSGKNEITIIEGENNINIALREVTSLLVSGINDNNAITNFPTKVVCYLIDNETNENVAQQIYNIKSTDEKSYSEEMKTVKFYFPDVVVGKKYAISVKFFDSLGKDCERLSRKNETIIEKGKNSITGVEIRLSFGIKYIYADGREDPYNGLSNVSTFSVDKSNTSTNTPTKNVYAWEFYDGKQYHYLFENCSEIPKSFLRTTEDTIKEKLLTLGDVVLDNHKIIPAEEDIDGRTPIGVLASLQVPDEDKPKVPLRVLSYKEETGLAWCSNEDDPGYNDLLDEPAGIGDKPCPLTGKDSFEYFVKTIYTEQGKAFDLNNFPIFKKASEMNDGGLTWFIPHGWEVFGCTGDEICADVPSNESFINKGLGRIVRINSEAASLSRYTSYWTSTLPNKKDNPIRGSAQAAKPVRSGWNTFAKTSKEPYTRFMATLDEEYFPKN